MSDTVAQKRNAVLSAYPLSKSWKFRVNNMSDSQITAVFLRLKAQGAIK